MLAPILIPFAEEAAWAEPQVREPKGAYATLGLGATWPQPVHYTDDRLGPRLPIRGLLLANPGFASDLGLGYDFGRLRTEFTWVHRQTTIDAAASSWRVGPYRAIASRESPLVISNSRFSSVYLDLPIAGTRLVPYLGGGLGYTQVNASPTTIQLRRSQVSVGGGGGLLSYQAKAGLAYRSSPRSDLFAEAVYQGAPARSSGSLERSPLNSWGLRLGVRWRFGGRIPAASPTPSSPEVP